MEWTCSQCGQYAEVGAWRELTQMGWTLTADGNCVCASCTARQWPAALQPSRHSASPARDVAPHDGPSAAPSLARRSRFQGAHPYLVLVK